MVHCNNGASELNAWAGIFREFATALGAPTDDSAVFGTLFRAALDGEDDAGGLLAYNYLATEVLAGSPLETVDPDPADVAGFDAFMARWTAGLAVEREAVERT